MIKILHKQICLRIFFEKFQVHYGSHGYWYLVPEHGTGHRKTSADKCANKKSGGISNQSHGLGQTDYQWASFVIIIKQSLEQRNSVCIFCLL